MEPEGFRVEGCWFGLQSAQGSGCLGVGCRVQDVWVYVGCRVQGVGCRVQGVWLQGAGCLGAGCRVQGAGLLIWAGKGTLQALAAMAPGGEEVPVGQRVHSPSPVQFLKVSDAHTVQSKPVPLYPSVHCHTRRVKHPLNTPGSCTSEAVFSTFHRAIAGKLGRFQRETFSKNCTRILQMDRLHVTSWYKILDF